MHRHTNVKGHTGTHDQLCLRVRCSVWMSVVVPQAAVSARSGVSILRKLAENLNEHRAPGITPGRNAEKDSIQSCSHVMTHVDKCVQYKWHAQHALCPVSESSNLRSLQQCHKFAHVHAV